MANWLIGISEYGTQAIINKDIQMISEHLSDNSKELVKPFVAFKIAFSFL